MKKILYVVSSLRNSGPTNQLFNLVSETKKKFDVQILTINDNVQNSRRKDFEDEGIVVNSMNLSRINYFLKGNKKILEVIEQWKPDLIHTSGIRADSKITNMNISIPNCMTIHNYAFDDYISKYGKFLGRYMAKKTLTTIEKSDKAIFCSNTLKKRYEKLIDEELLSIPNGIDIDCYSSLNSLEEKVEKKKKLNLSIDKTVIVSIGSLNLRKDPLTIIKAFNTINLENIELIVLGSGPLKEQAIKENRNNNVKFLGSVDNVIDYLQAADIFISASKAEGLPMSVLEASAVGKNLILSDISEHREIVSTPISGVDFFPVGDFEKLSHILEDIKNGTSLKNEELQQIITQHFTNRIMSEKYVDVYKTLLKGE